MAQYLKDEVRERIVAAAVEVFAAGGYEGATVGRIARRAGVSTGNVYRYFADKATLFEAAVPPGFVREWHRLLRERVRALEGVEQVEGLGTDAPFFAASEALLRFSLSNRLRVVILLGRAAGTPYHSAGGELVAQLSALAIRHYRALGKARRVTPALRLTLDRIYRHWLLSLVEILAGSEDERAIREEVAAYSRYHLTGLNALLLA